MSKIFGFGEQVKGYSIPVLNEREIRAAAGMLFVLMFSSIVAAGLQDNFTLLKYAVTLFLTDLIIRVFINPKFSPLLIIGRFIVRNQTPEYVGAVQKKFAWIIGIILAVIMFIHLIVFNAHSPINGIICMICLVFLFFETSFGICLGCMVYPWIFKDKAQYCPGEVCNPKDKQEIQKISKWQTLIVVGFIAFIVLLVLFVHAYYSKQPLNLMGM